MLLTETAYLKVRALNKWSDGCSITSSMSYRKQGWQMTGSHWVIALIFVAALWA